MDRRQEKMLEEATSNIDRARYLAVSAKKSGKWLTTLPSPQLGTFLDGNTLRISAALRLGAQMCEPHQCVKCKAHVDGTGTHDLSCPFCTRRPSHIKRALLSAGIPSKLEPVGTSSNGDKRPDGTTLVDRLCSF